MKTNRGFAPILIILILVAVVGIGLYMEKQTRNKENKIPPVINEKEPKQEENKNQEEKKPVVKNDCVVGGCSSQYCYDPAAESGNSTCEFMPQYACYRTAECKRQLDGKCGWTQTEELQTCIDNAHF